jgi:thiamine biosynthesis lipoprotein
VLSGGLLVAIAAFAAIGVFNSDRIESFSRRPLGVMGTDCTLTVAVRVGEESLARRALEAAERTLRETEARTSWRLADSEIARFNAAPAGKLVPLSPETLGLLGIARDAFGFTGGAFDVTCRPLIELWKSAAKEGRLPTPDRRAAARAASAWGQIVLGQARAEKAKDTACVDLGGIAKGFAADRAAEAMMRLGASGGLVEIGGDIRCFGRRDDGRDGWRIGIRNPFEPNAPSTLATLKLPQGGVCTSGNYFRFVEIQERRYSHIIDPRPGVDCGVTAEAAPSVTVVAPDATTADIWATALSVLGPEGFKGLPAGAGIEAMIVTGAPEDHKLHMTEGFRKLLADQGSPPRCTAARCPIPIRGRN